MGRPFPPPRPSVFTRREFPRREPPPLPNRGPPPLPKTRKAPVTALGRDVDLNRLGTGAKFRSNRLTPWVTPDVAAPLNEWVDVVSTWVLRSRYDSYVYLFGDEGLGDWTVEFLDGATVVYHDTPAKIWDEFFTSSSKGMFIYYRCKEEGRPYELIREGTRTVTAKQRFIREAIKNEGSRAFGWLMEMVRTGNV